MKKKKSKSNTRKNKLKLILFLIVLAIILGLYIKTLEPKYINKCIVIDAGHGGTEEPGCIFNNIYEKDICLQIAKKLEKKLNKEYKKVIMTRSSDVNIDLDARPKIANNAKADIFVSIHQNALEDDNVTSGIETWYHPEKDTLSKVLAQTIQNNIIQTTSANNLGIKESKNLVVTKKTQMPSCLVETGFLSSTVERKKLIDSNYQDKIVEGIYNGINQYFQNEEENK